MNVLTTLTDSHPVKRFYLSVFQEATRCDWFHRVYRMDEVVDVLIKGLTEAGLPVEDLRRRKVDILDYAEHQQPTDFFDLIRVLRSWFMGIHGTPAGLVAKAAVTVMHRSWPLSLTPDTLRIAKGYVLHLAEGVAPRDFSEFELSHLMLRPVLTEGMLVLHAPSKRYGEVVSAHSDNATTWRPFVQGSSNEVEADLYSIVPVTPIIKGLPLATNETLPRVTAADVWAEFLAVLPPQD